jgi:hypothetical protein
MSAVASAFRILLPCSKKETLNVVEVSELAMDIFNEEYIEFLSEIISKIDRTQLMDYH